MVITHHLMHSGEIFLNAQDSAGPWQRTDVAREQFVIQGLGERHNPLRRSIDPDYFQDQIFVRFQLQYGKDSIDDPENGDGEFCTRLCVSIQWSVGDCKAGKRKADGLVLLRESGLKPAHAKREFQQNN